MQNVTVAATDGTVHTINGVEIQSVKIEGLGASQEWTVITNDQNNETDRVEFIGAGVKK